MNIQKHMAWMMQDGEANRRNGMVYKQFANLLGTWDILTIF